ncbi:hypothetical protein CABS01_16187 [Colletotrichum abscissum]|uniref:uncharacterized protein n=1 Tax=Colletotrichum abscissum TaxID=1671311 RepID=UPI0027D4F9BB|nr:uncharacterized protein CABS01_16187 [Colletotrichum abscissum]KAK1472721.1 hypothetical protein CABS01_16187 [Colletotrichum abscissum]
MLAHVPPPITPIQHLATFHQGNIPPQTPSVKDTQLPHQELGDVGSCRHNPGSQKASHAPSAENPMCSSTQRASATPQNKHLPVSSPSRTHAQPAVHDTSKPRSAGILPQIPPFLPPEHPR